MKRVLLKLSGEALAGKEKSGFDLGTVQDVARQVKILSEKGLEISIVIGGGNFWRGRTGNEIERTRSDQIGMLATIMNCIYVSEVFQSAGMKTAVMTPFVCGAFTELFSKKTAMEYLKEGRIVFFAGGTGHPYFSTDTATLLMAVETESDAVLLAKAVDGVYDKDPKDHPDAKRFDRISIQEVVSRGLKVIDMTASILCMDNHMPMRVFALQDEDAILRSTEDHFDGTVVYSEE